MINKIGDIELTKDVRDVLSLIMRQEKLPAYALYCQRFKKNAQDGLLGVKDLFDKFITELQKNPEIAKEFIPEKSCSYCIGTCCQKSKMLKDGPWSDANGFVGTDCAKFMNLKDFEALDKRVIKFSSIGNATPTKKGKTIEYCFDGILLMITYGVVGSSGAMKSRVKRFIVKRKNLLAHLVKKFNRPYFVAENQGKFPELDFVLMIGKMPPKATETFKQYNSRVVAIIKKEREELEGKTRKLTEDEAFKELLKTLGPETEKYFKDICNGEQSMFMSFFYPDKDVWSALETEKRKRL